jgi:hypothetical protein
VNGEQTPPEAASDFSFWQRNITVVRSFKDGKQNVLWVCARSMTFFPDMSIGAEIWECPAMQNPA